jgi:ribonuclease G
MPSEILISVRPNQVRVAVVEEKELVDFTQEKRKSPTNVGSIFLGKVSRVLPGMQAAFVNIGLERAAFLYVGDIKESVNSSENLFVDEESLDSPNDPPPETELTKSYQNVLIQDILSEGDEILVQVAKDPLGTKGARLTTQISLPGRNLVYMPEVKHLGISRKIENEDEKARLTGLIEDLNPDGGVIVRTAGEGASADSFKQDLEYLNRLWKDIQKNHQKKKNPGIIYSDLSVELRALRDMLSEDVDSVIIDDKFVHKKVLSFVTQFMPRYRKKIKLYEGQNPLFDSYNIDLEISHAIDRKVWLKSGGYIVVDEAEALVVIDVNTGKFVGKKDLEDTIFKTNLEAVSEIAHQLRIRNCGGIVILDLIDMENLANREKVLSHLEQELKKDRAKTAIITMTDLGLVEMTRKRIRPSLVSTLCEPCPYCDGKGYVKRPATVANEIFRSLESEHPGATPVVHCHAEVADWIYEGDNETLEYVESKLGNPVNFKVEPKFHIEEFEIK